MFPGIGTLINVLAIIGGTVIGKFAGNRLSNRTRDLIVDVLGCVTLIGAASALTSLWGSDLVAALPTGGPILLLLSALLIGGVIGSVIDIEGRLDAAGEALKRRVRQSGDSNFVTGFVTASLIFPIGPLAILGSISDGMGTGIEQLGLKSTLDFFASIAFASSFGWGVAFSVIPTAIFQGSWTLIGFFLGEILNVAQVAAMTAVGGVLLFGISLRLLNIKQIAVGNLLPALAIAPIAATLISKLN